MYGKHSYGHVWDGRSHQKSGKLAGTQAWSLWRAARKDGSDLLHGPLTLSYMINGDHGDEDDDDDFVGGLNKALKLALSDIDDWNLPAIEPSICGNGIIEGEETCDGVAFMTDDSCRRRALGVGELDCTDECFVDTSDCHPDNTTYPDVGPCSSTVWNDDDRLDPEGPNFPDGDVSDARCADNFGPTVCVQGACVECDNPDVVILGRPIGCPCTDASDCASDFACRAGKCQPDEGPLPWQCGIDCTTVFFSTGYCHLPQESGAGTVAFCAATQGGDCSTIDIEAAREEAMFCNDRGVAEAQCNSTEDCSALWRYPADLYQCSDFSDASSAPGVCVPNGLW